MATTTNSALYTAQTGTPGQSLNVSLPQQRDAQSKTRVIAVPYTALGTEATGDLVNLCIVSLNSKVLTAHGKIMATASLGTNVTVRIGDSSDALRYAGTIDISAGGPFLLTATAGTDMVTPTAITTEATRTIVLKFVAITTLAAGQVVTVLLTVQTPE